MPAKRSRYNTPAYYRSAKRRRVGRVRQGKQEVVPGYTRVGGYYGRFAPYTGELKFHDVQLVDAIVATGGVITPTVNIIPQGVTEITRVGRKCTIKSFNWRYRVTMPEFDAVATPAEGDGLRVILYQDKQTNGAQAAATDVLETADIHSFRNLANSGRFVILMDRVHRLNYLTLASDGAAVVSGADVTREYTFFKKVNMPIEFNGVNGTIGEIRSNNYGVLLVSDVGSIGFDSRIRLRFSDS